MVIPTTVPHSGRERFEGKAPHSVKTAPKRHAGQRRRSLGSPDRSAVAPLPGFGDGQMEGFMTAPSSHKATRSLRASATTMTLRTRRPVEPTRSRNQTTCVAPGWRGTRPSHAPKSRPRSNASPVPMAATGGRDQWADAGSTREARRQLASFSPIFSISLAIVLIRSSSDIQSS